MATQIEKYENQLKTQKSVKPKTLPPLTLTKTVGTINGVEVISYLYPGRDKDLSYYEYQGKQYPGTVIFTNIISQTQIPY